MNINITKHLKQFDKLLFADRLDSINMIVIFDELNHGLVSGRALPGRKKR